MECEACKELNIAMQIKQTLTWKGGGNELSALGFDKDSQTITIDEAKLMRAIMLANPAQRARKIVIR